MSEKVLNNKINKGNNMNKINSRSSSDEEEELYSPNSSKPFGFFEQTQTFHRIQVYLDEAIREPSYYRGFIQRLGTLGEGDIVELTINTPGGRVDSAVSIINALRATEAEVLAIIDNEAASAGSLIALACPNIMVAPNSTVMIHNWFGGGGGKGGDIVSSINYNNQKIQKLMTEVYQGFLTEVELRDLFIGRDYYFDSEEIEARLVKRQEYFALLESSAQSQESEQPKVQTVKKKTRTK